MAKSRSLFRFASTSIVLIIIMIMSAGSVVTITFLVSVCDSYIIYQVVKDNELKKMLQRKLVIKQCIEYR